MERTVKKHFTISAILFAALPLVPMRGTSRPAAKQHSPPTPALSVDFEFYKTRVEPIFLEKRPGHARCYVCHSVRTPFRLEKLLPGSTSWTEEQSRRNFEVVSRLVTSGDPLKSRLLMHPLSPLVGGDPNHHQGGRQFESQDDPDWMTMAEWVRGGSAGVPGAQATAPSRAAQSRLSAGTVRIYITNSAGDTVDVIDPVADKVVQRIEGTEAPHDVNFSRDGNRV